MWAVRAFNSTHGRPCRGEPRGPAPPYRAPAGLHVARRFAAAEARFDPTAGVPPRPTPRRHDTAPSRPEPPQRVCSRSSPVVCRAAQRSHAASRCL